MVYAIEEEELVKLFKQAYEQGVYGHFDLAQSVAEGIVEQCESMKLTNPYYKPDYFVDSPDMMLCETEGARLDPQMVGNIFPASRIQDGIITANDYEARPEWLNAEIPRDNPGIQLRASSGNQISLVDHPVNILDTNSNQEGFHWESYTLIGEDRNESQESRKPLRG